MGIINSKKPNTCFRIGYVPIGTKTITSNGVYDVAQYANADVNVPQPSGTVNITSNGTHNVRMFETADVNVPQGVFPTGTKSITINGIYDVSEYANVDVDVPSSGIVPTGTKNITANGDYDITTYANAHVDVPQGGITPTGTKNITANGDYDVTTYANAHVDVPNVISGASILTGDFSFETVPSTYDLNIDFKTEHIMPYMMVIYDDGGTSSLLNIPNYTFKHANSDLSAVALVSVFIPAFNTSVYTATKSTTNMLYQNKSTVVSQLMRQGAKLLIRPSDMKMETNKTYHYILFYNTILYDFTNSNVSGMQTSYNIGDSLDFTDLYIDNVDVFVNGNLSLVKRLWIDATASDNISIDSTQVDMSTAGTYPLYVTVSWNVSKTFTIYITVV